jgi:hypothetical protein
MQRYRYSGCAHSATSGIMFPPQHHPRDLPSAGQHPSSQKFATPFFALPRLMISGFFPNMTCQDDMGWKGGDTRTTGEDRKFAAGAPPGVAPLTLRAETGRATLFRLEVAGRRECRQAGNAGWTLGQLRPREPWGEWGLNGNGKRETGADRAPPARPGAAQGRDPRLKKGSR